MSYLAQATSGPIDRPVFALIYAQSKVGKSTLGASAPMAQFLDFEDSSEHLNVSRLGSDVLTSFDITIAVLKEIRDSDDSYPFRSLVLDSADKLEGMIHRHVVKTINDEDGKNFNSVEDIGYAKGYIYALPYWTEILSLLREIQILKKMHIIIIGHANVKRFNDPYLNEGYDRFEIKLHHKAADLIKESVDMILFMRKEVSIVKDRNKKVKAFNVDERRIFTQMEPAFDAGSRVSLPASFPIPEKNGFDVLLNHIKDARELTPMDLVKKCLFAIEKVNDDDMKKEMTNSVQENKNDISKLRMILEMIDQKIRG